MHASHPPSDAQISTPQPGEASDNILVTGATGAVGRYIVDALLASTNAPLTLLARDAERARAAIGESSRVSIVQGDMREGEALAAQIGVVRSAVFAATSWVDGGGTHEANVVGTVSLATALRRRGTERFVWFGTASVLDHDGSPLREAAQLGTPYIASKAEARVRLLDALGESVWMLHPTLVVAGGADRPWSHVARLIPEIERRAWIARLVVGEGAFHLVHARDLARLTCTLLNGVPDDTPREVIVGAPPISLREALDLILSRVGSRRYAAFDLTPRRIERLVRLLRIQLSPWDRYCMERRDLAYDEARLTVASGEVVHHATAERILGTIPRNASIS